MSIFLLNLAHKHELSASNWGWWIFYSYSFRKFEEIWTWWFWREVTLKCSEEWFFFLKEIVLGSFWDLNSRVFKKELSIDTQNFGLGWVWKFRGREDWQEIKRKRDISSIQRFCLNFLLKEFNKSLFQEA